MRLLLFSKPDKGQERLRHHKRTKGRSKVTRDLTWSRTHCDAFWWRNRTFRYAFVTFECEKHALHAKTKLSEDPTSPWHNSITFAKKASSFAEHEIAIGLRHLSLSSFALKVHALLSIQKYIQAKSWSDGFLFEISPTAFKSELNPCQIWQWWIFDWKLHTLLSNCSQFQTRFWNTEIQSSFGCAQPKLGEKIIRETICSSWNCKCWHHCHVCWREDIKMPFFLQPTNQPTNHDITVIPDHVRTRRSIRTCDRHITTSPSCLLI